MKLLTYRSDKNEYLGVLLDGKIVDAASALAFCAAEAGGAGPLGFSPYPGISAVDVLANENARRSLEKAVRFAAENASRLDRRALFDLSQAKLAPPIAMPKRIFCLALNYPAHANEAKSVTPEKPYLFLKPFTSLIGHGDNIIKPAATDSLTYEAELAVIIAKKGKHIKPEEAMEYVGGYTAFNDVSMRDLPRTNLERNRIDWVRGKVFDTSAPMGPWIVTKDEISDPMNLKVRLKLNGELKQDGNTGEMVFNIAETIASISETITLEPGDVIATGTPAGASTFLSNGDVLEVEIESIGKLINSIVDEKI
ncbi:MAG: fumarylacetoacetate hydrolase family protein [Clostridiales Family XIII bacterium]|jgi:acylpyruvate hydrolase|nr:fumarylacetoacetate hydrolase family protein [Clostridiales Family XIII bacterium]